MQNKSQRSRKRVRVPAALHAELTEHAMLIKTIRTNHLLDLTYQLYSHASAQRVVDRENIRQGKGKLKTRDTWTTWPLIDCFIPEWRIEDEVKTLAEAVARQLKTKHLSTRHPSESQNDVEEHDDDELEPLSPSLLQALVWQATKILVCILDSILEQRPAVADSMQNRMWAFNWEGVLRVLISGMTLDRTVIFAAKKRLSSIYGSSKTLDIALSRIGHIKSRTSVFAELSESSMVSVLSITSIEIGFNVLVNHAFIITPLLVYWTRATDSTEVHMTGIRSHRQEPHFTWPNSYLSYKIRATSPSSFLALVNLYENMDPKQRSGIFREFDDPALNMGYACIAITRVILRRAQVICARYY
ncbi:uncharacterized protein EDB93DRAFT_1107206 [Suillus bovinus]|uniref:uncharacterized protein n=1 Tax=Suillus bovinus TaxID=48563 RepID=UPI001B875E9A|nr:uncharacterized protein EDB93DRAFT_1107206 [Suillus bovinus]KAG2134872.1 hypothetical protein EDB93DRAFT_1107206 [Suillus bovinus]